ncbi:ketosynthase chain-length factor [Crossiella sp. SN42]|uniref:ketosynthase chain-length factor n=1 Tax=Crossiella sp. SN42 TaxID=2944808 RepID=UPI00207D6724|nr:ketosynthase chain-length factor [Crossiella sp. SN42]MCO1575097.1 ketosynthase chain-length factor [Crossiella sp. SN42]
MSQDVLVTGIGVLAPNGMGVEEYWSATLAGRSGIRALSNFDARRYSAGTAGLIEGFAAEEHLPGRLLPQTDRVTRMALVAADWALADAKLDPEQLDDYTTGVAASNATGGFEYSHREMAKLWTLGPREVSVYQCFAWFYAVNTGQISIRNGLRGPGSVLVAEQAGGLDVLGQARRSLNRGRASVMLAGGVESSFDPWGWVSHLASGRVSAEPDPRYAYQPFDPWAQGYVPGEGGAILVLESPERVADRAVTPYGRICGYAATFDPAPGSGRPHGLRRAAEGALADAGISPPEVDLVVADAAGSPDRDAQEAQALRELFGPRGVPVCTPKALVGRLMAGGGPLDVVCALLAIRDDVAPPARHLDAGAGDYGLDLVVDRPRAMPISTVLVLARGEGGFNSAVVVRALS